MSEHVHSNGNGVVLGFLCGAVVGAGIALLTAPSSGEATRKRIGATARKVADRTRERLTQLRGQAEELRDHVEDSAAHAVDEIGFAPSA